MGSVQRSLLGLGAAVLVVLAITLYALGALAKLTSDVEIADRGVDAKAQTITLALLQEPPQLDSTQSTDVVSIFVLGHVMEGLLNYDEHGALVPGVAEQWDIRPDGASFRLRADATWNDGRPVTASDFVFAWRLAVDPKIAGQYAFLFYPIRNAELINTGKLPTTELAVKAVDDRTLEIEFERPIAYFDKLVSFVSFYPIREDFYKSRSGRYAANAEDLLFNGPFKLTRWAHGAHVRLEKNEAYWGRDQIRLNVIDMPYVTNDGNAHLNLFRDGRIAMAGQSPGLGDQSIKQAMDAGWALHRKNDGSVWYLEMNQRPGRLLANRNLRKALLLASDNTELVYRAMKNPGYLPINTIFPAWMKSGDAYFRQEYPAPERKQDLAAAREHLQKALKELGLERLPPIAVTVDDVGSGTKQAQYLQSAFKQSLGIDIRVDAQTFKQRIAKIQAGDFDLAVYGWGPDYDDLMTFGDLFASWNPNNHGKYSNPEVDRQVEIAQKSLDARERMEAFDRIQKILLEDAALIPNYERGTLYVQDAHLKGVVRRVVGTDPDFKYAYVDPN